MLGKFVDYIAVPLGWICTIVGIILLIIQMIFYHPSKNSEPSYHAECHNVLMGNNIYTQCLPVKD